MFALLALLAAFLSSAPVGLCDSANLPAATNNSTPRDIRAVENDPESVYPDLPVYTLADVALHATPEARIWIAAHGCVYDVTDFIEAHPGGDKILMAKGASAEPYWALYPIHYKSKLVPEMLDKYRVGVLAKEDRVRTKKAAAAGDPFKDDPERHPALIVLQDKPFNAASPMELIADTFLTPNPLFFTRNHHPVPLVDPETFRLTIGYDEELRARDPSLPPARVFTLDEFKAAFPAHEVTATLVCAGNRREEMNGIEATDGLTWSDGAVSTAHWRGARLRDVMAAFGVTDEAQARQQLGVTDVVFTGCDEPFDASIPIEKAASASGAVLLAWEMNGEEIPRDHGYPLRAVVPGAVGVRNVKWVKGVTFSPSEAKSVWQRGAPYKGFAPGVKSFAGIDTHSIPSVQALPVMSAIVRPRPGDAAVCWPAADGSGAYEGTVEASGWAYSGGGKGVVRVDVTADGGRSWTTANVSAGPSRQEIDAGTAWTWSLWNADVPLPKGVLPGDSVTLAVKAVDGNYNQQPERLDAIWNRRGILNNAWHKVSVKVDE